MTHESTIRFLPRKPCDKHPCPLRFHRNVRLHDALPCPECWGRRVVEIPVRTRQEPIYTTKTPVDLTPAFHIERYEVEPFQYVIGGYGRDYAWRREA